MVENLVKCDGNGFRAAMNALCGHIGTIDFGLRILRIIRLISIRSRIDSELVFHGFNMRYPVKILNWSCDGDSIGKIPRRMSYPKTAVPMVRLVWLAYAFASCVSTHRTA